MFDYDKKSSLVHFKYLFDILVVYQILKASVFVNSLLFFIKIKEDINKK